MDHSGQEGVNSHNKNSGTNSFESQLQLQHQHKYSQSQPLSGTMPQSGYTGAATQGSELSQQPLHSLYHTDTQQQQQLQQQQ